MLIESGPLHRVRCRQVSEVEVRSFAAGRGWRAVQGPEIARYELRSALPQPILKHLTGLVHRGSKSGRSGDAEESKFGEGTNGYSLTLLPRQNATMVLVPVPKPCQQQ